MRIRPLLRVASALLLGAAAFVPCHAQGDSALAPRRFDVPVPGAALATDLYAPPGGAGAAPAILVRTPYGREGWRAYGEFFARHGYVFLAQDVRGQGASTGRHVPFLSEEEDGAATLDWIAAQPWSNGRVGMMGPSYGSYASMVLVARGHPALKAVVNNSGMMDLHDALLPGGAFHLMVNLPWTRLYAGPRGRADQPWDSLFAALPVQAGFRGMPGGFIDAYPAFNQRLYDAGAEARLTGRTVPVLHLAGWNDFLYRHTLRAYERSRRGGAEQVLVMGPWAHDQQNQAGPVRVGGEDFGAQAGFGADSIRALALRWFDRHLKGRPGPSPFAPVRVFTMGANRWENLDAWPAPDARRRVFYLDGGSARGTGTGPGAGRLAGRAPRRAGFDEYTYDPRTPVPTVGGANFHLFTANLGPLDQRAVSRRPDVLSYTTEPFGRAATLAGPISATLYVSSSATDADFTAKLVLVRPDGFERIVEEGILRARYHRSLREPRMLVPGEVVPLTIDLGATALTIPAGARLRLEVSSGSFPKYDRNPQTGENPLAATTLAPAVHRIHHGPRRLSALTVWLRD